MFLLVWGTVLTLCSQLISPLVTSLLTITCSITEYELQLREEIRDLRRELSKISMQDQFSVYAKTERKINKLTEKLEACTSARSVQYSKASWAFTITFHSILGLTMMWTMWTYGSTPVLELPPEWTYPLTWFISLPTGEQYYFRFSFSLSHRRCVWRCGLASVDGTQLCFYKISAKVFIVSSQHRIQSATSGLVQDSFEDKILKIN